MSTTIALRFKNSPWAAVRQASKRWACAISSVLLAGLVACSQSDLMQEFSSPADRALAANYIDLLRQQKYEAIEKATDPSIAGPSLHDTLVHMASLFPASEPLKVTLIGTNVFIASDAKTINITYEYAFVGKWVLTNVAVKNQNGKSTIVGFNATPQPTSIDQLNRFTVIGKSALQYVVLLLCITFPLVTLFALIACIRTKHLKRKWLWVLFVILGVCNFSVNWTTGQWSFKPLSVQVFSAGAWAPLYGPWTLAVGFPIGAIIFLLRQKKLAASADTTSRVDTNT